MSHPPEDVAQDLDEPRSALTLRAVLAVFGLLVGVAGTVGFAALLLHDDSSSGEYVVGLLLCLAVALSAVVDLVVIRRRKRQQRDASNRA